MDTVKLEEALADPASAFASPEEVLRAPDLADDQKIEILRRWEFNASEEALAVDEGMRGEDSDLLRRILIALGTLAGPLDLDHTAPSKNHGLPRSAIKKAD